MTIVYDPSLGMESSKSEVGGGTTPFMAPELLVPSRFGLDKCTPTKEADIYAMGMVIYQVRTARCPVRTHIDSHLVGPHWNTTVR
jgi:serine/threonine protein kinase